MYLDLDLHFCDAVSQAFHSTNSYGTPQVLVSISLILRRLWQLQLYLQTFSIHYAAPGFFPVSPLSELSSVSCTHFDPFSLSLPLRQGASNPTFARIWPIVERTRNIFEPDFVVLQCGVDGLAGDPCATWNWSLGSEEGSLGWCIGRVIKEWPGKKLLLGGGTKAFPSHCPTRMLTPAAGGYNSPNAARAWTYLTSIAVSDALNLKRRMFYDDCIDRPTSLA